jgi:hypothetical protein
MLSEAVTLTDAGHAERSRSMDGVYCSPASIIFHQSALFLLFTKSS